MDYIKISDSKDRIIRFGISEVERYKTGEDTDDDPWWNIHVFVKKAGINYDSVSESMTESELWELVRTIDKAKNNDSKDEKLSFTEPDYEFVVSDWRGILDINISHVDSLRIWLTRENLEDISNYIKSVLKKPSIN